MPCGLQIRLHPKLDILCREDGAILTRFGWKFGSKNSRGYLTTQLSDNKCHTIHRLIAEAFIPNPLGKPTVDHIDRDKTNNFVSNLRWATVKEQIANRSNIIEEIRKFGFRRCDDPKAYNREWSRIRCLRKRSILIESNETIR